MLGYIDEIVNTKQSYFPMAPELRPYQFQLEMDIHQGWHSGHRNVMAVSPVGSGKTTVFSSIMRKWPGPSIAIAHRQELVTQMSLALARNGVRHRIIAQPATIRMCVQMHMLDVGISYFSQTAPAGVAGVDTLVRRPADAWCNSVTLWIQDEAHHVLQDNKWGIATTMFPNAYGLGVTATPTRTDGKGLGADTDGVFHTLVSGPTMRELIDMGYLSEYRIYAPPNNLHLEQVRIAAGGDFNPEELREAVHAAHIHGDVVDQYLKIASGKLGITFTVDVESAVTLAEAYRQRGVPAEAISGKTPANIRYKILQQFSRGEIKQICNCDVLGEGFDVPAIEVVSMARPTQSYGLYVQQFGRGLRIMDGKERAILIDHVGNTLRHGLPDATRDWSLDRRARRNNAERELALKACPECTCVYERHRTVCPYCGYAPEPIGRALPEQVDGDLAELDPEVLAQMRGAVEHAMALRIPYGAPYPVEQRLKRIHRERVEAQHRLRQQMALWGGARVAEGLSISEAQRLWYLRHGVDVMSAQALNAADATELMGKIK